jgi:tetratricopeptide (TPR) repeat protein
MLDDSTRIVRLEAARLVAPFAAQLPEAVRGGFARVAEEYIQVQRQQADRPEKRIALGALLGFLGRQAEAEAELLAAIRLAPVLAPAYVNLADLYRQQGREDAVRNVLQLGLSRTPEDATLHHSLGLAYVRARRLPEAIAELARASELATDNAQYAYVYAVALNSAGRGGEAIAVLERAIELHPTNREILVALATFNRDAGRAADAIRYAEQLAAAYPADAEAAALLESLHGGLANEGDE